MTDVNNSQTSLLDAINVGLSCLGERPVSTTTDPSTNVVLAKQIIKEVSNDVQSKGWWFNTTGSNITITASAAAFANSGGIPEEARRYITIRSARILQSRFVGSEELLKFSFQEEQVSLAILTQANVRNGGSAGDLGFTEFPSELRNMGVEEVLFLQQSAEEKLLSLRLVTELKTSDKIVAEKELINDQEDLVEQQVLTEVQNTSLVAQNAIKTAAEAGLVTSQQALIAQQVLDVVADTSVKTKQGLKIDAETALVEAQEELTDAQKATELQNAIKVAADAGLVTSQQALVAQQVIDTVAETALKGAQKLKIDEETDLVTEQKTLVAKQALTEVQTALKTAADAGLVTQQQALVAQQVIESGAKITDIGADTTLKGSQSDLIDQQKLTEVQNTLKTAADAGLVTTQQALVASQVLESGAKVSDIIRDTEVKGKQKELLGQQKLTEVQNTLKVAADAGLVTQQQALIAQQALDVAADTTLKGAQKDLIGKQELTEVQNALKVTADAGLVTQQQALLAQQVLESVANVSNITADAALKTKQGLLSDAQKNLAQKQSQTEVQNALKVAADTGLVTQQQALIAQQTLDSAADVVLKGQQGSLVSAQAATEAQNALKVVADAGLVTAQQALVSQQVLESVANVANITADKNLKVKQGSVVDAQALDVAADTALKGKQGIKLDADTGLTTQQQALTAQQALDVAADTALKGKQGSAIDADTALKTSQKTQLDAQTAIEATAEKAFYDGVVAGTQDTYRDYAAEMRMMGIQEVSFQQLAAYKKVELVKDAKKLRDSTATESGDATELAEVNKVMRFIGEPPVVATRRNSLASECLRLLRDTDKELQGRGWWFNTEEDVELENVLLENAKDANGGSFDVTYPNGTTETYTQYSSGGLYGPTYRHTGSDGIINTLYYSTSSGDGLEVGWLISNAYTAEGGLPTQLSVGDTIRPWLQASGDVDPRFNNFVGLTESNHVPIGSTAITAEANDYDTIIKKTSSGVKILYDLKKKSVAQFSGKIKAEVIYQRPLIDTPDKYREYLSVRVALLLTELYPQSGVDIQRLPKMEAELRAYFKDRDFDQANYTMFDNYDTASILGVNRPLTLI